MTQPNPESQMNSELRQAAQYTARVMRDLLALAQRAQQRRWASQRATDRATPGLAQDPADRMAKLAVGWTAANQTRESNPDLASRWDRVVNAHGIDPQTLYDTVTKNEALRAEAAGDRQAAMYEREQAQAYRDDAVQEKTQAQQYRGESSNVAETATTAVVGGVVATEMINMTGKDIDSAVTQEIATLEKATAPEGAVDPDSYLGSWFKSDLTTALNNRDTTQSSNLSAQPPTAAPSLGLSSDKGPEL